MMQKDEAKALRLRLLLELVDISGRELAVALGTSPSAVSRYLDGRRRPSPATRRAMAEAISERVLQVVS